MTSMALGRTVKDVGDEHGPTTAAILDRINKVATALSERYSDRRALIDLILNAIVARNDVALFMAPGTAHSSLWADLTKHFSLQTFFYSVFDGTDPSELFGPTEPTRSDPAWTLTSAHIALIDEVCRGNSALVNRTMAVLSERGLTERGVFKSIPLRTVIFKSSAASVDCERCALLDRIPARYFDSVENRRRDLLSSLDEWLTRRDAEARSTAASLSRLSVEELDLVHAELASVQMEAIHPSAVSFVESALHAGMRLTPRRLRSVFKTVAVATLRRYKYEPEPTDMWPLQYLGDSADENRQLAGFLAQTGALYSSEKNGQSPTTEGLTALAGQRVGRLRVFVSYSRHDKLFAERLASDLVRHGADVWFDEWEIRVGDSIVQKIQNGLDDADFILVVLSPRALESKWVERELRAAVLKDIDGKGVRLLPVLREDCRMPSMIADVRYADFRDSYDVGMRELIRAFS